MTACQYPMAPGALERDRLYQHKVSLVVRYFMIPCNICLILLATSTLGFAVLLFLNNCRCPPGAWEEQGREGEGEAGEGWGEVEALSRCSGCRSASGVAEPLHTATCCWLLCGLILARVLTCLSVGTLHAMVSLASLMLECTCREESLKRAGGSSSFGVHSFPGCVCLDSW